MNALLTMEVATKHVQIILAAMSVPVILALI